MKKTEHYVIFWGGIYSNWAMTPFEGRVAYNRLIPMLEAKGTAFPPENSEISGRLRGKTYANNEQWMMACKAWIMGDLESLKKIQSNKNPKEVKAFGREVRPFDQKLWSDNCEDIVTAGLFAKFTSSQRMTDEILSVGKRKMVEGSPHDRIWGIGIKWDHPDAMDPTKWRGQNKLGKCLDRTKEMIEQESSNDNGYRDIH